VINQAAVKLEYVRKQLTQFPVSQSFASMTVRNALEAR